MVDFAKILKRGKKLFNTKDDGSVWGRCEDCNARNKLYKYFDEAHQCWMLCDKCLNEFTKDEDEEE